MGYGESKPKSCNFQRWCRILTYELENESLGGKVMNKTDVTPEKVSKMIHEFFIKNGLALSTNDNGITGAEGYNKNLKWLLDRKIPTYQTTNNINYGDVLSFDKIPKNLILYTPEFGGYIQYITPKGRYYTSTAKYISLSLTKSDIYHFRKSGLEINYDSVTISPYDSDTEKFIYSWGVAINYDLTELILRKNKQFMNWDSFEPWDLKS